MSEPILTESADEPGKYTITLGYMTIPVPMPIGAEHLQLLIRAVYHHGVSDGTEHVFSHLTETIRHAKPPVLPAPARRGWWGAFFRRSKD